MEKPDNFRFVGFLVSESHIVFKQEGPYSLKIDISPAGKVRKRSGEFILFLEVKISDQFDKFSAFLKAHSTFHFQKWDEQQLKPYLLTNAPAITFPFVRAYLANLTAQSSASTVMLPTLNLSGLHKTLEEKLVVFDE